MLNGLYSLYLRFASYNVGQVTYAVRSGQTSDQMMTDDIPDTECGVSTDVLLYLTYSTSNAPLSFKHYLLNRSLKQ